MTFWWKPGVKGEPFKLHCAKNGITKEILHAKLYFSCGAYSILFQKKMPKRFYTILQCLKEDHGQFILHFLLITSILSW